MNRISYHKRFAPDGTVYDQAVQVSRREIELLDGCIRKEQDAGFPFAKYYGRSCGEQYVRLFLKTLRLVTNDCQVYFLTLTQRDFIANQLGWELKDRNTCLLVKEAA